MRPSDNPFRSARIDALPYRYLRGDADALWAELTRHGHRGAIVGPMGTGKTTLLDALAQRYQDAGRPTLRLLIPFGAGQPPAELLRTCRQTLSAEHVLLLDGLEQLSRIGWWRLRLALPRGCGLVATTHHAGRLPTVWQTETTAGLLLALTEELAPRDLRLPRDLPDELFRRHRGDIRQCLRSLYDYCASLP